MNEERYVLWELAEQAGWAMAPIYLCSILGAAVAVRKLLDLRDARLTRTEWVEPVLERVGDGELERARELTSKSTQPLARVADAMICALAEHPEQAEDEAERVGLQEVERLEKNMRLLALIAEIAPLLGLLGTVLGMVDLFMGIHGQQSGTIAMAQVSSGIWKALLTTAAGLLVAVPTLAVHTYVSSRVARFRTQLTVLVQRLRYVATK